MRNRDSAQLLRTGVKRRSSLNLADTVMVERSIIFPKRYQLVSFENRRKYTGGSVNTQVGVRKLHDYRNFLVEHSSCRLKAVHSGNGFFITCQHVSVLFIDEPKQAQRQLYHLREHFIRKIQRSALFPFYVGCKTSRLRPAWM